MNRNNASRVQVLERLAREVLMIDGQGADLTEQYANILAHGLPKRAPPERRDVIVLGAGIAGLITGWLLTDAGYNVTIIEANKNRIGGRVKTFRTKEGGDPAFKDPRQYAEAGAMRIPASHKLVNQLIDTPDLGLCDLKQRFYNVSVDKDEAPTFSTWIRANSVQARITTYSSKGLPPGDRTLRFPVPEKYANCTAADLLARALVEPQSLLDQARTVPEQIQAWATIIDRWDEYSMRRYLFEFFSRDPDARPHVESLLEYIGTLQNLTSRMFLSFFHSYVDTFYIRPGETYYELRGGNWQLPEALGRKVTKNLVFDARAIEIQWSDPATGAGGPKAIHCGRPGVYVRTIGERAKEPPANNLPAPDVTPAPHERIFTGDYLVVTIPFSALRFVTVGPDFSYPKRRAIIELHYDSATKVLLEFSERFWEWGEDEWRARLGSEYRGHAARGGGSVTDGPNRFIYFPSHQVHPDSRGGVILASYSWADDANRWDSMPDDDRYGFALKGLVQLYGEEIRQFFTGAGRTQSWMQDFYAYGEAAVFTPGQLTGLHPYIPTREGVVHFAGEHTSLKHAWIEGAIESGVRAALEIHAVHGAGGVA